MKKVICIVLFMLGMATTSYAGVYMNVPIDIAVNGRYIKSDVRPFLISGTTYVPIRFVSEALRADEIVWDGQNDTAVVRKGDTEIIMPVGKNYALINGQSIQIPNGVRLVGDRTFVPVRFVSECFGAGVSWDGEHLNVLIEKPDISVNPGSVYDRGYSNENIYWLGRIIDAEAEGEPMNGKIGVGDVVLNRVKSDLYPDTVYEVIFDTKFGVQFEPVINGRIYQTPSFDSLVAAKYCLQGENIVGESLFFLNPVTAASSWITTDRQHYTTVGNHHFYL